ncbi:MAG: hypothetical protein E6Q97_16575 [Desulfurellales bacterium]|nr:MAG: hypothetical protein E6Q97_16575 [Desulfurellales bacterium]
MTTLAANAAVNGHQLFTAEYLDGSKETVSVRALKVREYERYVSLLDNEPACAELLCSKPEGWADRLNPDSLGALVTLGEEINARFFRPWWERRAARHKALLTPVANQLGVAHQESPSSSQISQPAAAAQGQS